MLSFVSRYPRRIPLCTASSQFVQHEIGQQKMPQVIYSKPLWLMWKATWAGLAEAKWKGVFIRNSCRDRQGSRDFGVLKHVEDQALHGWFYKGHLFGSWICICMQCWHPDYLIYYSSITVIRSSQQSQVLRSIGPESADIVPSTQLCRDDEFTGHCHLNQTTFNGTDHNQYSSWSSLVMFPPHKSCSTHRSRSGAPHTFPTWTSLKDSSASEWMEIHQKYQDNDYETNMKLIRCSAWIAPKESWLLKPPSSPRIPCTKGARGPKW